MLTTLTLREDADMELSLHNAASADDLLSAETAAVSPFRRFTFLLTV